MPIAMLVHLSGPRRGATWRLAGDRVRIVEGAHGLLQYAGEVPPAEGTVVLALRRQGSGFHIEPVPGARVWVNGERVHQRALAQGDLIEAGDTGILLRYRLVAPERRGYKTVREAVGDCVDCARFGARGPVERLGLLLLGPVYELATQVAPTIRAAALLLVIALVASVGALWQRNLDLQAELDRQLERIEGLSRLLESSERAAFSRQDVESVRSELDFRIDEALARVEALEARSGARSRVIAKASRAVIFLQGSYGFVEPTSGRALRHLDDTGAGAQGLTLRGDGPPLELRYTGSGFVVGNEGLVLTNRHVATPWEFDENARHLIDRGFTPTMVRFVGYLPEIEESFEVRTVLTHTGADLAILRCGDVTEQLEGLSLAEAPPEIGQEVIVLGYPTGMRALLARADRPFVDSIMSAGTIGFWDLAAAMARHGSIRPLATVGVIGQVTAGSIVYDAETTHGGSGGPVLTLEGKVVAVNAAILPEFGGSNLGVPATLAAALLQEATRLDR